MRQLLIGVLATSLASGACGRADMTAAPNQFTASTPDKPVATAGSAASVAPAAPAVPAAAAEPAALSSESAWREVTLPAGTSLRVMLDKTIGSDISRVEESVSAHLASAVAVQGATVLASGSAITGVVTNATRSGKVKGRAHVAARFTSLTPRGDDERYRIHTSAVARTAAATKKKDAVKIGVPAAGGAVIGALVGGKKGALVGTAVGGGAGSAVVLSTRGKEVRLPKGAVFTVRLTEPLTVRVKG